jgi:predicted DNA-binding protein
MALNARLTAELEALLTEYCERTGSSRSEVLREALAMHLKAKMRATRPSLYSLAADLIPPTGLAGRQSRDVKRIMAEHWRGKRAA